MQTGKIVVVCFLIIHYDFSGSSEPTKRIAASPWPLHCPHAVQWTKTRTPCTWLRRFTVQENLKVLTRISHLFVIWLKLKTNIQVYICVRLKYKDVWHGCYWGSKLDPNSGTSHFLNFDRRSKDTPICIYGNSNSLKCLVISTRISSR